VPPMNSAPLTGPLDASTFRNIAKAATPMVVNIRTEMKAKATDLNDFFSGGGLSSDPGITMKLSKNGQAWYAWRRTVTGWYFAIGATGPPPNRWEYDGPEPPHGFPGKDPRWGERPFSDEANPNWIA